MKQELSRCSFSQFGLMDAILDEKLGFEPKRIEGELLLCKKKGTGK